MINTLECRLCKELKLISEYSKDRTRKTGLKSYCKKCSNKQRQNWISKNSNKIKEYNLKYKDQVLEKYYEKQKDKQEKNKCLKCNCSLIGRYLSAKYCVECKEQIKKEWKINSYKRNIITSIKYNKEHRKEINLKNASREQNRRDILTDRYITKILLEKNGFTVEQIKENRELIEIKRIIIKTKRLCKTSQN